MSALEFQAHGAIAFQLELRLESYERDVAALAQAPLDPELYHRVGRHVDQMRMYANGLPTVSVAWVELTIRHFEFMHGLWRAQQADGDVDLLRLQEQLRGAVRRLSLRCRQLMPTA